MAEVSQQIFLGTDQVFGFYDNKWVGINSYEQSAAQLYSVRNDPYSASLVTAQPFSIFSELGMTSVTQSIDGLIRNNNISNSYMLRATGSSTAYLFASASVVSSGSGAYDWSTEGYTSSISQENSQNIGVVKSSDYNIAASSFVIEGWFNFREGFGNPPFHSYMFGNDVSGDYVMIQYSTGNVFRFYVNGTNSWSTTPSFTAALGTWYHVAFVKTGVNVYVYLNGNRIGVGTRAATVNTPPNGIWNLAGINSGDNNDGVRKNVQDLRFYLGTDKGYTGATITVPLSIIDKT